MEQAQAILTQYSGFGAYLFFFCLIFACGVGLPFNSDISLITASVLAAQGFFNFSILMILAFTALMCGDTCTFFAGRKWGKKLAKLPPFRWIIPEKNMIRAENFLNTRGTGAVFFIRFMPLIRTALFFTSGTLKVKPRSFYLLNGSATMVYLPLIMGTSYYASGNIDQVTATLKRFQLSLLGAAIVAFIFVILKQRSKPNAP